MENQCVISKIGKKNRTSTMITQKQIKKARIENQELLKNPEKYSLQRVVGRLNLTYLKALEQVIDTMILNKNMFKQDTFCIEKKELYMFVSPDTISIQELADGRITGVGYRTLVEEFDIQNLDLVEKALIDYDKRSSLHTELVYINNLDHPVGLNIELPKRTN